ncbi:MAG: arylesterase [Candidatus Gracilibacteria bacterium]|nr:arylesterase [Candidatus Gracilibacteria bacterium]
MKYLLLFLSLLLFSCGNNNSEVNKIQKPEEKKIILCLGDSLTAGYGVQENENYPYKLQKILDDNGYNYLVINAGVSGDTSQNILSRASLYLDKKPNIVILVAGGNDGLRGLSTTDLKNNILGIVNIFKGSKVVIAGMDIPLNLGLQYKSDFKKVYSDISNENKNIYFLKFFLDGVAGKQELNIQDMIHPNSFGYDIIVKNLFDFLKENKVIE